MGCRWNASRRPQANRSLRRPGRDRAVRHVVGRQRQGRRRTGQGHGAPRLARPREPGTGPSRRPPASRPGLVVGLGGLVRLRVQGGAAGAWSPRASPVLPSLLRILEGLPTRVAGLTAHRGRAGARGPEGQGGRRPDLRQVPRRHRSVDRGSGRHPQPRLAEPTDLPTGDQLHRAPARRLIGEDGVVLRAPRKVVLRAPRKVVLRAPRKVVLRAPRNAVLLTRRLVLLLTPLAIIP